jgi:hypothetical protein
MAGWIRAIGERINAEDAAGRLEVVMCGRREVCVVRGSYPFLSIELGRPSVPRTVNINRYSR